jgi:acetoin utilization deacetylase AcuC-like enzyme
MRIKAAYDLLFEKKLLQDCFILQGEPTKILDTGVLSKQEHRQAGQINADLDIQRTQDTKQTDQSLISSLKPSKDEDDIDALTRGIKNLEIGNAQEDYLKVKIIHRKQVITKTFVKEFKLLNHWIAPTVSTTTPDMLVPEVSPQILCWTHSNEHVNFISNCSNQEFDPSEPDSETEGDETIYSGCKFIDNDTYFNRHSTTATNVANGGLIALASNVVTGRLKNGFALIRPPGHHADPRNAQGFCLYNNVAVATNAMKRLHPDIVKKVLIVDFDVHHGNGTQNCFWDDPTVLFFSIHRHDGGAFYPNTGYATEIGGPGAEGFTINMPLPGHDLGDDEYFEVWTKLLLPVAKEFQPDLIFISAGFDCAEGDPLGGMRVSSNGFGWLTALLLDPGICPNSKVVMSLEGGYNVSAVANGVSECISALLQRPPYVWSPFVNPPNPISEPPIPSSPLAAFELFRSTQPISRKDSKRATRAKKITASLRQVAAIQQAFWPTLKETLLTTTTTRTRTKKLNSEKSVNDPESIFEKQCYSSSDIHINREGSNADVGSFDLGRGRRNRAVAKNYAAMHTGKGT